MFTTDKVSKRQRKSFLHSKQHWSGTPIHRPSRKVAKFTVSLPVANQQRRRLVLIDARRLTPTKVRFERLAEQWKEEAEFLSSPSDMAGLSSYKQIISMGPSVIPLILNELRREPHFWFSALRDLTNSDPVPRNMRGDVVSMTRVWLDWGQCKGYI